MTSSITLFIAQLDKRIDDQLLKEEFEKFGIIHNAMVAKDETGASKGYGFVHFAFESDGIQAMKEMDGKTVLSREISVQFANRQMDGNCYVGGTKTTYWANEAEWEVNRSQQTDFDDLSDISSQTSDSTGDEYRKCAEISDVKQRLLKLFEDQLYTDVVFFPKNSRKTSISGHKVILAAGSPLFAQMLFGENSEKSIGMKMEIEISNMSFDAFKYIVRYLYSDDVDFENDALAQAILDGAKQFDIKSLVQRCQSYFEFQELTDQNVCTKLQMSMSNKIEVLKKRCVEYIQKRTQQVIKSPDFLKCTPNTIRTICKLQSLNLPTELHLLHAVMKWASSQNVSDRSQLLEPLIKCFRFLTFTVAEFGDVMKLYPDLLSAEDGLKIIVFLSSPSKNPNFQSLPSWLNKNLMKRCVLQRTHENPCLWNDLPVGKVVLPLRPSDGNWAPNVEELTSLLQMRCIEGHHQIKSIKLAFQGPLSDRSEIRNVIIRVHVSPSGFSFYEPIEIVNSLEVTVSFSRVIKARRGDLVDIEVEAKNMKFYRFLQFDETCRMPLNRHFTCCVSSKPKCGKLYFIKEIEYGPQEGGKRQSKLNINKLQTRKFQSRDHNVWT